MKRPNQRQLQQSTLDLRAQLDAIQAAIEAAQEFLDVIETAAGLVRADGNRIDEPAGGAQ